MRKEKNDMIKENVDDYIKRETLLMELEYELIQEFVKLRKDLHLTQQQMADSAHVIRETIARIETQITSPQISTLIKILEPLGYTLKIEKIKKSNK